MSYLFTASKLGRYSLLNNFYNGTRFQLFLTKNVNFFFFFRYFLFPLKKLFFKKQSIFFFNTKIFNSFFFSFFNLSSFFLNGIFSNSGLLSNQFYAKKNFSVYDEKSILFFKNIHALTDLRNYSTNISYISLYPLEHARYYNEISALNNFSAGIHAQKTPFFQMLYPFFADNFFKSINLYYYHFFLTLYSSYNFPSYFYFNVVNNLKKSYPKKRQRYYILSMRSWFFLRFFFSFFFFKKKIFSTKKVFLNVYKKSKIFKRLFFKKKYFKTTLFSKFAKAKYAFYVKKHKPYYTFKKKFRLFKQKIFFFKKRGFAISKYKPFSKRLHQWKRVSFKKSSIKNKIGFKKNQKYPAIRFAKSYFSF